METPLAERMLKALLIQMLRSDAMDPDDITEAADALADAGDEEAAHELRCMIVEAVAPSPSDWQADKARSRFRSIDGGKPPE